MKTERKFFMNWNITLSIIAILISLFSVYFARDSIRQQKTLAIKQVFIEREADILIEFRNALWESIYSLAWVSGITLFDEQFRKFTMENDLPTRIQIYSEHFNKINHLNKLYNANRLIFIKHGVNEQMPYIQAILGICESLAKSDLLKKPLNEISDDNFRKNAIRYIDTYELLESIMKIIKTHNLGKDFETRSLPFKELSETEQKKFIDTFQNNDLLIQSVFILKEQVEISRNVLIQTETNKLDIKDMDFGRKHIEINKKYKPMKTSEIKGNLQKYFAEMDAKLRQLIYNIDNLTVFDGKAVEELSDFVGKQYPEAEKMFGTTKN